RAHVAQPEPSSKWVVRSLPCQRITTGQQRHKVFMPRRQQKPAMQQFSGSRLPGEDFITTTADHVAPVGIEGQIDHRAALGVASQTLLAAGDVAQRDDVGTRRDGQQLAVGGEAEWAGTVDRLADRFGFASLALGDPKAVGVFSLRGAYPGEALAVRR